VRGGEEPELLDEGSVFLAVTSVRQIWPEAEPGDELYPYSKFPEFEVEGWLRDPAQVIT
jgi:hypothetical protein